jgi:hypothetical protein
MTAEPRPAPADDPFVRAAQAAEAVTTPAATAPEPASSPSPAASAKRSLFDRAANVSETGRPVFDLSRIVVESPASASPGGPPRGGAAPSSGRVFSRLPPSGAPADAERPTFDLSRIVVEDVHASVA